jgi:hypothetical protein
MSTKVGNKERTVLENRLPSITFMIDPATIAGMSPSLYETLRAAMQIAYFNRFHSDFSGSVKQIKELEVSVTFLEMIYFLNLVTRPDFKLAQHSKSGRLVTPSSAEKWLTIIAKDRAVLERSLLPESMLLVTDDQQPKTNDDTYRPVSPTYSPHDNDVTMTSVPPPSGSVSIVDVGPDCSSDDYAATVKKRKLEGSLATPITPVHVDASPAPAAGEPSTSSVSKQKGNGTAKSPSAALGKPMKDLSFKDFMLHLPKCKLRRYRQSRTNRVNTVMGSNTYGVVRDFVEKEFGSLIRLGGASEDEIGAYREAFLHEDDPSATEYLVRQLLPVLQFMPITLLPADRTPPAGFGLVEDLRKWRALPTKLFTHNAALYDLVLSGSSSDAA